MKNIQETVDLPDAAEQLLVHPLDLVEARKPFVVSWWLSQLSTPTVLFLLAAVLWTVSNNYITPVLIPVGIGVGATYLARILAREAWAYVPRRRQDTSRPVPRIWSVLGAAISTVALLVGLVLLAFWIIGNGVGISVVGYILGTGAGIVLLIAAGLVWTLLVPGRPSASLGGPLAQCARLVAVLGAVVIGYLLITTRYDMATLSLSDVLTGAIVIVVIQVVWWLFALRKSAVPAPSVVTD